MIRWERYGSNPRKNMKSITKLLYICLIASNITSVKGASSEVNNIVNLFMEALNAHNNTTVNNFKRNITGLHGKVGNDKVKAKITSLIDQAVKSSSKDLDTEIASLKAENKKLTEAATKNTTLTQTLQTKEKEIATLKAEIAKQKSSITGSSSEVEALQEQVSKISTIDLSLQPLITEIATLQTLVTNS